jgi:hypothetical protein
MAGKLPGSIEKCGVGHRCVRIAISALVAARGGMPAQQLWNGSDEIGAQHAVALKPC